MAEKPRGGRGNPHRDTSANPRYPPASGEEDESMPAYHLPPPPPMAPGVTLPSIQDTPQSYAGGRGYPPPPDPRSAGPYSASPGSANGYPAPPGGVPQPPPYGYHPDQRYPDYYLPQQRYPPHDPYVASYAGYRQAPGPAYAPYPGVGVQQAVPQPQAAPRQRTSIACRYCRKRKIRCSGYQNTTNGKCTNCDKLRIDCVFQPVSSNSSTAFVPITAVPGGVPPGTPLYGAYGQPLPAAGPASAPPPEYAPPPSEYQHPLASPASQYPHQTDDRAEPSRRRHRGPEDDPGLRLPPPNPYAQEEDPRRRSPASGQSTGTPPTSYHQYQASGGYEVDRTPTPRSNTSSHPPPSSGAQNTNIMSLGHLVDQGPPPKRHGDSGRDIDQSMLGKLNRRS